MEAESVTFNWQDKGFSFHIPCCPPRAVIGPSFPLQSPSSFFIEIGITLTALLLSFVTFCCYNSISLPNRTKRIVTRSVSNSMWSLFFLSICVRSAFSAIRNAKRIIAFDNNGTTTTEILLPEDAKFTFITNVCSATIHAFTSLFLMLALNYQRKYRRGYVFFVNNQQQLQHKQRVYYEVNHAPSNYEEGMSAGGANIVDEEEEVVITHHHHPHHPIHPNANCSDSSSVPRAYSEASSTGDNEEDEYVNQYTSQSIRSKTGVTAKMAFYRFLYLIFSLESLVIGLLFFNLATLYLRATGLGNHNTVYEWLHVSASILQQLPILALCVLVLITPRNMYAKLAAISKKRDEEHHGSHERQILSIAHSPQHDEPRAGPFLSAKILLILAFLLNIPNDLPLSFWYSILHGRAIDCPFYIASVYDAFFVAHWLSLLLWFWFMRAEYVRNQEEAMYTEFSRTNEFDYRRFPLY